jgi:chromosome segregation ATPase
VVIDEMKAKVEVAESELRSSVSKVVTLERENLGLAWRVEEQGGEVGRLEGKLSEIERENEAKTVRIDVMREAHEARQVQIDCLEEAKRGYEAQLQTCEGSMRVLKEKVVELEKWQVAKDGKIKTLEEAERYIVEKIKNSCMLIMTCLSIISISCFILSPPAVRNPTCEHQVEMLERER